MSNLEPAVNRPRVGLQDAEATLLRSVPAHNLLLIGPPTATRAFIDDRMSSLTDPVVCWDGGTDLPTDSIGTLIIHDVPRLTPANQHRLLEWLNNQSPRRAVIATSIEPFYRCVETGLFSDGLYYRLNTVTVVLDRQPDTNYVWDAA